MLILICSLLILGTLADGSCPIYECKNIDNHGKEGADRVCGKNDTLTTYTVDDDCDPGFSCYLTEFFIMLNPPLPRLAFCEETPATKPETRYPGDVCTTS